MVFISLRVFLIFASLSSFNDPKNHPVFGLSAEFDRFPVVNPAFCGGTLLNKKPIFLFGIEYSLFSNFF